ncbi:emp24/gp25L/p24 family/GOLD [Fragilaria crotonensis]|nr:emp24/gp25L/p24 family/GOLD [Fragilaria crotonensis]
MKSVGQGQGRDEDQWHSSSTTCRLRPRLPQRQLSHQLLFVLILQLLLSLSSATFVLNVPAYDEVCFVVRIPPGPETSLLSGSYDVLDDDIPPDPIVVHVYDEKFDILYTSQPRTRSGTFAVVVTGRVNVCVISGFDHESEHQRDHHTRQVGLNVQVKTLDKTSNVMTTVQRIQSKLWNFRSQYDYMRTREAQHRELAEETFTKLLIWNVIEGICVLLASGLQILYMRRFVEKRRAF